MDHNRDHQTHTRLHDVFLKGTKHDFKRGDLILSSDDSPSAIYYIASGYVKVYSLKSSREQYLHIIYGTRELFPLVWLTEKVRHNVFYQALTDCTVYCLELDDLRAKLKADAELAYEMMQFSIEQHRIYSMRVDNLEYKYASERLAYRLLLLAYRFGTIEADKSVTIGPPLTHLLLGSSINLSRESVSREMEKLLRKNLVRYNHLHQIVIPDSDRLLSQFKHVTMLTPPKVAEELNT